ncbi:hypothetical protein SPHINGO8BC_51399 [Sphingobacterium multivorum]|uniref:Uncharacterized protein n=1 Tax=Sphingobacterium multivorum TaxID=28454 RepID=A0A654D0A9_SPHMU|nr:hypothetical protein SPHINGO8BC_51399 [Sphingobacterium multivorum]
MLESVDQHKNSADLRFGGIPYILTGFGIPLIYAWTGDILLPTQKARSYDRASFIS